jgi:hypothetical protein
MEVELEKSMSFETTKKIIKAIEGNLLSAETDYKACKRDRFPKIHCSGCSLMEHPFFERICFNLVTC